MLQTKSYTANFYPVKTMATRNFGENLHYLWKRAVRITKKSYTPQGERLCLLLGKPVKFTVCGKILYIVIIGFS